ncbi:pyrroline-5-carboxylate reductase [bacterium]|nr:pyrroline-5-carboxylate reductase [bacterium]
MGIEGKIAFVGGGAMAEAILRRLLAESVATPGQLIVSEPVAVRRETLAQHHGIQVTPDNSAAAEDARVVVLAVKPQVIDKVATELSGRLQPDTLVISIMAGIRISTMRKAFGHEKIVRSMPNTPAQVGKGMTVWTATSQVSDADKTIAQTILEAMGDAIFVADEHYLDAATGLSGSGPGFVFLLIEAMIDAGVHVGFSRAQAERMVLQTLEGSVALARESNTHPAVLRNLVTSPAGTTAAGTLVLERANVRATLIDAVEAAYRRSKELGDLSEGASH